MIIRTVTVDDTESLLGIYSYYVEKTAISFEYDTPSKKEFAARIRKTLVKYPFLVAESAGRVVGYAYAGVFKNRAAYDHCVEVTVYVDKDYKKQGIGKALYLQLENKLYDMGITNLYACIAVTDVEDAYLTNNSRQFHEHMGYRLSGRFHACGKKFGNVYDMIWMEKIL